jgi:hypothetical protein
MIWDTTAQTLPLCGLPHGVMFPSLFLCAISKCFATRNFPFRDGDYQKVFVNSSLLLASRAHTVVCTNDNGPRDPNLGTYQSSKVCGVHPVLNSSFAVIQTRNIRSVAMSRSVDPGNFFQTE